MLRTCAWGLLFVVALGACDGRTTSSPTPTGPTSSPPTPAVPTPTAPAPAPDPGRRISGAVVDAAGTPVRTATVTFFAFFGEVPSVSDELGRFDVTVDSWSEGLTARVAKDGYEVSYFWVSTSRAAANEVVSQDLRLHRPVVVRAGAALDLTIRTDDPFCGFDFEYHCRRVRVAAPGPGTLTARVVGHSNTAVGLALESEFPRLITEPRTIRVDAASDIPLDVLVAWTTSENVPLTVSTSWEPR